MKYLSNLRRESWTQALTLILLVGAYGALAQETSSELGETPPIVSSDGSGQFPDVTPVPTPTPEVTPAQIEALRRQLDATLDAYLVQREWQHNCAAPGGCWLWQKTIDGVVYRLNTDEASNVEFFVQAEEEEARLRLQVSE